jgi:hypothetical protein
MHPYGTEPSTTTGDNDGNNNNDDPSQNVSSSSHSYMSNTTQIDVMLPPGELLDRFPDFVEKVVPVARQAELEEGDLLFMPPG